MDASRAYGGLLLLIICLFSCEAVEEADFRRRLSVLQKRNLNAMPDKPSYNHPFSSRIDAHFTDMDSFHRSSRELEEGPTIACIPYKSVSNVRVVLEEVYKGVHIIFQDYKLDRICFMMTHLKVDIDAKFHSDDKKEKKGDEKSDYLSFHALTNKLDNMQEYTHVYNEFTAWHYMHPVMKINPSLLNHLFRTETKFSEVTKFHSLENLDDMRTHRGLPEDKVDDLRYELLVDFVPSVENGRSRKEVMDDIHNHLHDIENTLELLEKMEEIHPDGRELWSIGRECGQSIFDTDVRKENVNRKKANDRGSRRLFSSIAEDYYHGFKIISDHLHGWGDRMDPRRLASTADRGVDRTLKGERSQGPIERMSEGCYIAFLAKLALHPEVLSISLRPRLKLTNDAAKSIIMSNNNSIPVSTRDQKYLWSLQNKALDGTGQVITIADTGLDQTHCFFASSANDDGIQHVSFGTTSYDNSYRKVVQYVAYIDSTDGNGHGTHVVGSAIGSNYNTNANELDGMAIGGKVAFFDIGHSESGVLVTPSDYSDMFVSGNVAGSRIFSGAFGYAYNYYSQDSVSIDTYSYSENQFYLSIWSAGNEGQEGWYTVIDPSLAKNGLSVGASEGSFHGDSTYSRKGNKDNVPYFSSVGPTFDFRFKPEVVVPGMVIQSAEDGTQCSTKGYSGTSMAAGILGGAALIMRQYLTNSTFGCMVCKNFHSSLDGHIYGPTAALLKASLINSAQQMTKFNVPSYNTTTSSEPTTIIQKNLGISGFTNDPAESPVVGTSAQRPDFVQGFGRVDLSNIIPVRVESHWNPAPDFNASFHDFGLKEFDADYWWFTMPSDLNTTQGERGFKVTLAWMDPPNSVLTEKFLLHDLDLIIEKVDNSSDCTVRSPSTSYPIWFGNGGSEPDTHNNVEMIHIPSEALQAGATYRVIVRTKALLQDVEYQYYGLVMTYPIGCSISFRDGKRANGVCNGNNFMGDYWEKSICDPDTHLETEFFLTSHSGNGWDGSSEYQITDRATGEIIKKGGMSRNNPMSAIREKMTVCLDASTSYEIALVDRSKTDERLYNMGVLSTQCKLKLQGRYITKESIDLSPNEDEELTDDYTGMTGPYFCNQCESDEVQINFLLWSSLYGGKISYGWHGASYEIKGIATNAPNAGIVEHHSYCVASGASYDIGFAEISTDDDFGSSGAADSGFRGGQYGYEEYMMDIAVCSSYAGTIRALDCNYSVPCINSYIANCVSEGGESPKSSQTWIIIFIVLGSFLACCAIGARFISKLYRTTPTQVPSDEDADNLTDERAIELTNAVARGEGAPYVPGTRSAPAQARPARPGQHAGMTEVQAIPILGESNGYTFGNRVIRNRPIYQVVHVQEPDDSERDRNGYVESEGARFTEARTMEEGREYALSTYTEAVATEASRPKTVVAEHVA